MCGICGIYNKGSDPVSTSAVIQMREVMVNRGPDDAGVYIGDHIGLGHRRLSIIDLTEAGRQPLCNEDKQIWLVVNGEIYNYIELKGALVKTGHIFGSKTDSEVIVHGYEEWGTGVFEKLNGAFSVAIWDTHKKRLVLARDRIGKKPLFYLERNGSVIFASDIKSILTYVEDLEIDEVAIDCYLTHICVPQAHTIFKGIKKIQPAHYVIFDKNTTKSERYWHLSFKNKNVMDLGQCFDETLNLLKISIKDRMNSDVPMGVFLSGGIDSSLIVALLNQLSSNRIKTFSVGFDYQQYNELPFAKKVADKYDTEHREFTLTADYLKILPRLVWEYGEPFADPSAIPSYYISKIAREHIKVALCGDGGDESFAGYERTLSVFRATAYKKMMTHLGLLHIVPLFSKLLGNSVEKLYPLNRIRHYSDFVGDGTRARYKNHMGFYSHRDRLYSTQFKERLGAHHPAHVYEGFYDQADGVDDVDRVLYVDFNAILPDSYQVKMDVASMSNALEARAPFLDYRLIEFAAKIPTAYKMRRGHSKYILKKIAEKYIPHENIYRQKQGFDVPIGAWFRKELKPYIYSIILSDKAKKRGYFDYGYVQHIIDEHLEGKGYHDRRLWALLWLELWHRMFVDKKLKFSDSLSNT